MNTSSLSILRFVAAIIIVLFHNRGIDFLKSSPKILTAGPQFTTFFFVLSGFVLMLAYHDKNKFPIRRYFVKRISRIFPVYLLALLLSVGLIIFFRVKLDLFTLLSNVFLVQSWFSSSRFINAPGWFLSDLMFFYVSFPIILIYLKKFQPRPAIFFTGSFLLWIITQVILTTLINTSFYQGYSPSLHDLIFYFPLSHFCSFILGVSGAYVLVKTNKQYHLSVLASVSLTIFLCFAVGFLIEYQLNITRFININLPYESSFYGPIFLLLIVVFVISNNQITSKISSKPFVFLGEISFPIFILQIPVRSIAFLTLKPQSMLNENFFLIYISILIALGMFLSYFVEKPIQAYVDDKLNRL